MACPSGIRSRGFDRALMRYAVFVEWWNRVRSNRVLPEPPSATKRDPLAYEYVHHGLGV